MIDWRQKLLEQKPSAVVVRNARLADTEDAAKVKESPLERLQGAIVDNEKAEQEGNNAFDGNLYLYYALRQLSTPEKALQYCADIDASIQDQHEIQDLKSTARTSEQDPLLEMEVLSARSSNSSKASKRMGRSTARAAIYRNVMRSLDLGSPFASILKASMRWMTPFLQVIAPLTIISKAFSNIVSNKKMWIDKCGGVEDFCRYMQEYRFNMIFDPSVANEAPGQCQLGEASLFSMNKFFLFNPYSDAQSYMWMTKLLCCVFVYGVGVRISVDLSNDHRNRQKAILVSRYFLQKLESIALGRRESKRPYTFTDFCICASGFIRMTIAVLMLIAMASILWLTNNPTDVVLDALGLVFIYSLDSVGSEFGLLSSRDWNVDWMGQLYSMVVEPKITTEIVKLEKEVVVGIMNSERSRKSKKRSILGRLRSSPSIDTASQYRGLSQCDERRCPRACKWGSAREHSNGRRAYGYK
eukprot:GEMP01026142.1.p1 GENE.GEMP01026142.1~~GEMP01026142.1.p1  ORF type:complete len:470 (+),score=77.14 GEMP01026142.1:104-1513(+)